MRLPPFRAALAAGILIFPLLFLGDLAAFVSRSLNGAWNLGHLVLFFVLTIGLIGQSPLARLRPFQRAALGLVIAAAVAVAIEWLQGFIGRSQSVGDVLLSLAGTALALLVSPWWTPDATSRALHPGRVALAAALLTASVLPTAISLWDEAQARAALPELAGFSSRLEMTRLNFTGAYARVPVQGEPDNWALQLRAEPGSSAWWVLLYFPGDWSSYRTLTMRVRLDGHPLSLQCVLNDRAHDLAVPHEDSDHYSERFQLQPGWQELRIDLTHAAASLAKRRMEMAEIAGFRCGTSDATAPSSLLLDYLRLEP